MELSTLDHTRPYQSHATLKCTREHGPSGTASSTNAQNRYSSSALLPSTTKDPLSMTLEPPQTPSAQVPQLELVRRWPRIRTGRYECKRARRKERNDVDAAQSPRPVERASRSRSSCWSAAHLELGSALAAVAAQPLASLLWKETRSIELQLVVRTSATSMHISEWTSAKGRPAARHWQCFRRPCQQVRK